MGLWALGGRLGWGARVWAEVGVCVLKLGVRGNHEGDTQE